MAEPAAVSQPHWLNAARLRVYPAMIVAICSVAFAAWIALALPGLVDLRGKPVGWDFITFWSAARLALAGRAAVAFDWSALAAVEHQAVPALGDVRFLWHYPPTFLLLVLPLGLLPYLAALGVFVGAGAGLWVALARALLRDRRAWLAALATPAALINLLDGQNGFLTAGLAGFALLQLERRPRLAGALIGLLAIKPHLAALFPVALVAARRWQALAAAALSATLFAGLGLAAFGGDTALAFLRDLPTLRDIVDRGALPWGQMPSAYVAALSAGAPPAVATVLQAVVALGAAFCVWRAWRSPATGSPAVAFEARAAVLLAGSVLVSPYLFTYDLTWVAAAIGCLVRLGLRDGFGRGERDVLFAAWLAPALMVPFYWMTGVQLGAAMLVLPLGAAMRRAVAASSARAPASPA
ncbi:MAG TPA: glycosyltransferase family 87 protein [Stellaceae bacterium]|nr:glycosyltransferase family 87 protein [Stellaceae bacterium]